MDQSLRTSGLGGRRLQLVAAIIAMAMIAPLQYAWTLFVEPLSDEHAWSLAAVQVGFTIFVVFQSFTQPVTGGLVDRLGPRPMVAAGAALVASGWCAMGLTASLPVLYAGYAAVGIGAGIVYVACIGTALRWYPDRRGLAVGLVTAGFGAGALPFIPLLDRLVSARGTTAGFVVSGIVIGVVLLACAALLRHPPAPGSAAAAATTPAPVPRTAATAAQTPAAPSGTPLSATPTREVAPAEDLVSAAARGAGDPPHQYSPTQMIRTGRFWLIFVMYLFMATGGLLVTANLKPFAVSLGVASGVVVMALTLAQIPNGLSRIVWGWVSDRIGRLPTMAIAFTANGILLALLPLVGDVPGALVVLTPLVMFTWGETFALIPAVTADTFGTEHAAANNGVMYTAKGFGGLFGGALAAWLASTYGWTTVFLTAAGMALAAAAGALILLRIGRRRVA